MLFGMPMPLITSKKPIQFISASASSTQTISIPSGVQNGDFLVFLASAAGSPTSTPSGWTSSGQQVSDGVVPYYFNFWLRIANSEPASYTVGTQFTNNTNTILNFRGGNGLITLGTPATATYNSSINAPSMSTTGGGFLFAVLRSGASWSGTTPPSGMTTTSDTTGSRGGMALYRSASITGATGAKTVTHNSGGYGTTAILFEVI